MGQEGCDDKIEMRERVLYSRQRHRPACGTLQRVPRIIRRFRCALKFRQAPEPAPYAAFRATLEEYATVLAYRGQHEYLSQRAFPYWLR